MSVADASKARSLTYSLSLIIIKRKNSLGQTGNNRCMYLYAQLYVCKINVYVCIHGYVYAYIHMQVYVCNYMQSWSEYAYLYAYEHIYK